MCTKLQKTWVMRAYLAFLCRNLETFNIRNIVSEHHQYIAIFSNNVEQRTKVLTHANFAHT
jgi:hypothetical protein